jgi:Tfp pilus assembly protein PilV
VGDVSLATPHPLAAARHSDGFMLIEVMFAAFVLTVGMLGMISAFDGGRKLSLRSERRTAMAHRVQLELERLQSYPYAQLAMISAPAHSSETSNPDYYVSVSGTSYQYGESGAETESLVAAAKASGCVIATETECGLVAISPTGHQCSTTIGACEWKNGNVSGRLYDFITWHTDTSCGAGCPAKENYKRLTVVATVTVPAGSPQPAAVRVSTLVAEPGA